jgi:hypothetical protein
MCIYDLALKSYMNKGKWKCSRFTLSIYHCCLGVLEFTTNPFRVLGRFLGLILTMILKKIYEMPNYDILPWFLNVLKNENNGQENC